MRDAQPNPQPTRCTTAAPWVTCWDGPAPDLDDHPACASADLSTLQLIIYGASPMAPARLVEGIREFGPVFMQR